jgi:hypothetical protein
MRDSLDIQYGTWFSDKAGVAPVTRELSRKSISRSNIVTTIEHALLKSRPHIWVPPTAYSFTLDHLRQFTTYVKRTSYPPAGGTGVDDTLYSTCGATAAADLSDLKSRAVLQALNNLKGMKVNYAQAFAERRQVASLVTSTAIKLGRAMRRLRHRDVAGAARALGLTSKQKFKGVAESWLELQYGWKPLLADVAGSMENLYDLDHQDQDRYRVTVRGTANGDNTTTVVSYSSTYYKGFGTRRKRRSAKVRLDYYLQNPALAQASGLGLINPIELAWELVPYSFIADWFIPVGDYLSAMDADLGFLFRGGTATTRQEDIEDGVYLSLDKNGSAASSFKAFSASGASRRQLRFTRTVYANSPFPRLPGFKNPFSLTHMANAVALMSQIFRGGSKVR